MNYIVFHLCTPVIVISTPVIVIHLSIYCPTAGTEYESVAPQLVLKYFVLLLSIQSQIPMFKVGI